MGDMWYLLFAICIFINEVLHVDHLLLIVCPYLLPQMSCYRANCVVKYPEDWNTGLVKWKNQINIGMNQVVTILAVWPWSGNFSGPILSVKWGSVLPLSVVYNEGNNEHNAGNYANYDDTCPNEEVTTPLHRNLKNRL